MTAYMNLGKKILENHLHAPLKLDAKSLNVRKKVINNVDTSKKREGYHQ